MSEDCPKPKREKTCYNCGESNHMLRDCPKPKDYSKMTCPVCKKKGHLRGRCPEAGYKPPGSSQAGPSQANDNGGFDSLEGPTNASDDWEGNAPKNA